jgi:serine/threonine protein kinase
VQLFEQIRKGEFKLPRASDECRDFLARMLTVDPEKRITIREAFEHPWMTAGPAPQFPAEPPAPYIGLAKVESMFDKTLLVLDWVEPVPKSTSSGRIEEIPKLVRMLQRENSVMLPRLGPEPGPCAGKRRRVVVPSASRAETPDGVAILGPRKRRK